MKSVAIHAPFNCGDETKYAIENHMYSGLDDWQCMMAVPAHLLAIGAWSKWEPLSPEISTFFVSDFKKLSNSPFLYGSQHR